MSRWKIAEPSAAYKALEVQLVLARRERKHRPEVMANSRAVAKLLRHLEGSAQESFLVVCCDNRNQVLGVHEVCRGSANQAIVEPREVFQAPLLCGATAIILAHNHPSGSSEPSQEDLQITQMIAEAANMLGFRLLDHVIIGEGSSYVSFADRELI